MKQFLSFVVKEMKHILRDKRTMLILFVMPIVLMLLFGFAITNDVRNVRTVIVSTTLNEASRQAVERLQASPYFTLVATATTPAEAEHIVRGQCADMAVVFGPDHSSIHTDIQFIVEILIGNNIKSMPLQHRAHI